MEVATIGKAISDDDTVIQRIEAICFHNQDRILGVRMKMDCITVDCNYFPTTKENAMACFRALKAILPPKNHYWGLDRFSPYPHLEIMTFTEH